jgi:predicted small secreted protein
MRDSRVSTRVRSVAVRVPDPACTRVSRRAGFHVRVRDRCTPCSDRAPLHANEVAMKRLIAMLVLACFTMGPLTACNTMAGAGKDVQKVGEKVEQKAEDCKDAHC